MKKPQNQILELSHLEIAMLRCFAVGMGRRGIKELFDLSEKSYWRLERELFEKMGVKNAYFAVLRAFRIQLLSAKEFCPEDVKAVALSYAHQMMLLKDQRSAGLKYNIWMLYDLLIGFEGFLLSTHFSKHPLAKKKSHRSGNED